MAEQILTATADEIKAKLDNLAGLAELDLKKAMGELKQMLLDNPSAVQAMQPEDLGQLVAAQRRMVGAAAEVAKTKKASGGRKPAAKKLSVEDLDQLSLDDL